MTATCTRVRDQLLQGHGHASAELETHLVDCAECARFASELDGLRAALQDHHARVEPDAGFAVRVTARLVRHPAEDLGYTAVLVGNAFWSGFDTARIVERARFQFAAGEHFGDVRQFEVQLQVFTFGQFESRHE